MECQREREAVESLECDKQGLNTSLWLTVIEFQWLREVEGRLLKVFWGSGEHFQMAEAWGVWGYSNVTSNKNVKVGGKENNLRDSRGGDIEC